MSSICESAPIGNPDIDNPNDRTVFLSNDQLATALEEILMFLGQDVIHQPAVFHP